MPPTRIAIACSTWEVVHGKRQWQIAAELGIAPSFLSHWCQSRRIPSAIQRAQMARYFGLDGGDELVGPADEEFLNRIYQIATEAVSA